jgi:hypothetical protein
LNLARKIASEKRQKEITNSEKISAGGVPEGRTMAEGHRDEQDAKDQQREDASFYGSNKVLSCAERGAVLCGASLTKRWAVLLMEFRKFSNEVC